MRWRVIAFILCFYGALKEFRPTEPYLYNYQHDDLNISKYDLSVNVYPYSTYSYLVFLLPILLFTDVLLYKLVLFFESGSFIGVWLTLIYGKSVFTQQLGQVFYGLSLAAEIAYFSYIYVKVEPKRFAVVTVWTKAALLAGRCFSYFLSEIIILCAIGSYQTLNYITLASLICTLIFALLLPNVKWQEVVNRHVESNRIKPNETVPDSYLKFLKRRFGDFTTDARAIFNDKYAMKWSLCYSLTLCGYLQIGNYIQTLWGSAQEGSSQTFNGFVEGTIPLISIFAIMPLTFNKWGELWIGLSGLVEFGALFMIALMNHIWPMYIGYGVYRVVYQVAATISQRMIIERISIDNSAFVFGLNTFVALVFQTILSVLVTKIQYLNDIRRQLNFQAEVLRMLRLAGSHLRMIAVRHEGTNLAASGSTGIEHAIKFKQLGQKHKQDFKDYKCSEYLHYSTYSFYDKENDINPSRVPQPTNKEPDVEPKFK
ncbi:Reduced folate carrier [Aphelenchoides bicaudatus]|nr:Reduced folate carrier [Aphelenchoides bicaudatus]